MFQLTNRLIKEFSSLDDAKGRRRTGLFVAEGAKCVGELLGAFHARYIFALPSWLAENSAEADEIIEATPAMLRQLTRLPSTPPVIAFFDLPAAISDIPSEGLILALDRVQDPGNIGTILRCCDWMGVKHIVASAETADCFNPKAVQASMGALAHVDISYTDLAAYLAAARDHSTPVYGTFMNGDNIYTANLGPGGILLMGNEGHGIGDACAAAVSRRITIPPFPAGASPVESLNVGVATAIALSQFRSRMQ